MGFLHGIEHLDLASDFTPVNDVPTAVVGLIGTAAAGAVQQLVLCKNAKDDAQFGKADINAPNTIPNALAAIRSQEGKRGGTLVVVVNVGNEDAAATDEQGNVIGTLPNVVDAIVGGYDGATGERTGLLLFELATGKFGFEPMIYLAPGHSTNASIVSALTSLVAQKEAMAYIDTADDAAAVFTTVLADVQSGKYANLNDGIKLLHPSLLVAQPRYGVVDGNGDLEVDPTTGAPWTQYKAVGMAAYAAGLRARIDLEEGWHVSSSNHQIQGVSGIAEDLTFSLGDESCEVNILNSKGVVVPVLLDGAGIREWGNYMKGYPGNMGADAFECVRRTRAIMKRAIQKACTPYLDKPFIQANVDAIRNTVNNYLNTLTAQGKIVSGICEYLSGSNPVNELAQGHLCFDITFTPALPMQRLTFTYKIDLNALTSIA